MSTGNVGQILIDAAAAIVAQIQAGIGADVQAGTGDWSMPLEVSEITDTELKVELADNQLHINVVLSNQTKSEMNDRDRMQTEAVFNVAVRMHPPETSLEWEHKLLWIAGEIERLLRPTAANAGLTLPQAQAANQGGPYWQSVKWILVYDADFWRQHNTFISILQFTWLVIA